MPWELLYYEAYSTESLARERERRLKHHGNAMKQLLRRVASPSTRFSRRENGAGFTLIELLISIAILGALLGLGVPAFRSYNKQVVFDAVAESVAAQLTDARTLTLAPEVGKEQAVIAYGVAFDSAAGATTLNRYATLRPAQVISEVKRLTLPSPIRFDRVPADPILFPISGAGEPTAFPSGAGTIVLRNPTLTERATRTLTINQTTGQVSVK